MDKNFAELHVHTNNSISDAVSTIDDILIRCKELGINSVAITDHGIVMGVREFYDKAKTYGIKPLIGVEAYYDDGTEYMNRGHVCIYAKDEQGYWAIMQAVSESNREGHLIEKKIFNRVKTFPTMNAEIFTRYFGTGSKGWDHVILTSACAGGILSGYTMWNVKIDKEINKIKKKIAVLDDFDNPAIRSFYDMYSNMSQEYDQKRALLKQVKKEAGFNISTKKQRLSKIKDADKASIMQQEITELQKKASYAKTLIPALESEILSLKDKMTQMKVSVQKIEKTKAKYKNYMEQIAQLEVKKLPEDMLLSKMEIQVISICDIVGKNNFYIELQYHGLENEKYAKSLEILIARKLRIKLCAANDAHFVRKEDWKIRKIIQTLAFEKYTNPGVDEKEYYIKTEEELRDALLQAFEPDIVDCALQGTMYNGQQLNYGQVPGVQQPINIIVQVPENNTQKKEEPTRYTLSDAEVRKTYEKWNEEEKANQKVGKTIARRIGGTIINLVVAAIVFLVVKIFLIAIVPLSGDSMFPTYHNKDKLLMEKVSYYIRDPEIDEIIYLKLDNGTNLVKRVVGIPGDTIQIIGGVLYRNEEPVETGLSLMSDAGIAANKIKLEYDEFLAHIMKQYNRYKTAAFKLPFFNRFSHFSVDDGLDESRSYIVNKLKKQFKSEDNADC